MSIAAFNRIQRVGACVALAWLPMAMAIQPASAADCNGNGIPDDVETTLEFGEHLISDAHPDPNHVVAADLDDDGDIDLLVTSNGIGEAELIWLENLDGAGGFGAGQLVLDSDTSLANAIATDVDGDGDNDIVASLINDRLVWFEWQQGLDAFGPEQLIAELLSAETIKLADLDDDGDLDLLALPFLTWYEKLNAPGAYGPGQFISAAGPATAMTPIDADGDGDIDVAASSGGTVWWHENLGAGTFGTIQLIVGGLSGDGDLEHADVDGDGDSDLVSASAGEDTITWYENTDGAGTFGSAHAVSTVAGYPRDVELVDIDLDGDLDIVAAAEVGDTVSWFENLDGFGSFGPQTIISDATDGALSIAIADLSGDRIVDIVSTSIADDSIRWIENLSGDCNGNQVPDECEADCNNDGVPNSCDPDCNSNGISDSCDIESGTSEDCDGNGVADECQADCNLNGTADSCDLAQGTSQDCNGNLVPDSCEPDCDLDGIPDVCELDCNGNEIPDDCDIASGSSEDCNGDGIPDDCGNDCNLNGEADECDLFSGSSLDCDLNGVPDDCDTLSGLQGHSILPPGIGAIEMAVADLDNDGDLDVVAADPFGWFENLDGLGTFAPQVSIGQIAVKNFEVEVADLDGDGNQDVLAADHDSKTVAWHRNLGNGEFSPRLVIQTGDTFPVALITVDMDADGDLDVITASQGTNGITWIENDGSGNFSFPHDITYFPIGQDVFVADLDGDGDPDLLTISGFHVLEWYENVDGEGTFAPEHLIAQTGLDRAVSAGDLDGDGDLDVIVGGDDGARWYENLGGASAFTARQEFGDTDVWRILVTDFNSDGDQDLFFGSLAEDSVLYYENDGTGEFATGIVLVTDATNVRHLALADIDGDLIDDLLACSFDVLIWYEDLRDDCNRNQVPDICEADCDGDGLIDACELLDQSHQDCNANGIPDSCDVASGTSADCSADGVPDECDSDCNGNGEPDSCDIQAGAADDCGDGIPDECQFDCNGNRTEDGCDISSGQSVDCNSNQIPDECDLLTHSIDCSGNGIPDECESDCNENGVADVCDISAGVAPDCNSDGVLDQCQTKIEFKEHVISDGPDAFARGEGVDLDGDGDLDLLSLRDSNFIVWYENRDGRGDFGQQQIIGIQQYGLASVAAGDLDSDGDMDVFSVRQFQEGLIWYENTDGLGTFGPGNSVVMLEEPTDAIAADVDGDGDNDLLHTSFGGVDNVLWNENLDGEGNFGPNNIIIQDNGEYVQLVAPDVDGDGDPDVVAVGYFGIFLFKNTDGLGNFDGGEVLTPLVGEATVVALDVDRDGDLDLVYGTRQYTQDNVVAWMENTDGNGAFGEPNVISDAVNWTVGIASADFTGDGYPDLMRGSNNDHTHAWYANDGNGGFGPQQSLSSTVAASGHLATGDIDGDGDLDFIGSSTTAYRVAWYENLSNDCNGNGSPDSCDPDCNGNAIADSCDVSLGLSVDCNGNATPDECDTGCFDLATCDADSDQCADALDCAPGDPSVWSTPGNIHTLEFWKVGTVERLRWNAPLVEGAEAIWYDTLSTDADPDFTTQAICVESDQSNTVATISLTPDSGGISFYLIRAENGCSGTNGAMGADSDGTPRSGPLCPE